MPYYALHKIQLTKDLTAAVNLATGNLVLAHRSLAVNSPGVSQQFSEVYNSLDAVAGSLGGNWRGSYGQDIGVAYNAAKTQVTFRDTSGFNQVFVKNADSSWKSPVGLKATLTVDPSTGNLVIRYNKSGEKVTFNSGGFILSDLDRNGIGTEYAYAGADLSSITDAAGRVSTVAKTATELTVTLPDNRVVYYKRDASGRLIQAGVKQDASRTKLAVSTEYTYGGDGKVATATINSYNSESGTVSGARVTYSFVYDSNGRVGSVVQLRSM